MASTSQTECHAFKGLEVAQKHTWPIVSLVPEDSYPVQGLEWSTLDPSHFSPSSVLSLLDLIGVVAPGVLTVGQDLPLPLLGQD